MKYIDAYLRKKKPETFMDYAPGEIPKNTEKTSVGAIHESPAKTNTISTITPAKISNTYTTSNRDLQNIHRNRTNAERHTGRSLRDESNRRTTNVGAIQESPAINHRFAGKAETIVGRGDSTRRVDIKTTFCHLDRSGEISFAVEISRLHCVPLEMTKVSRTPP